MNIRQQILSSFVIVTLLFIVAIVSAFWFHVSSIKEYKQISEILILENTLTESVFKVEEAYNALASAPLTAERKVAYESKREHVLNTLKQLDASIIDSDSKVAYRGLSNVILSVIEDFDSAQKAIEQGDVVTASKHYAASISKKSHIESNSTLLILKELHYLDRVQQNIEKKYFKQLFIVSIWLFIVILMVMTFGFLFSGKLTSPIKELFTLAKKVALGDYHLKIPTELLEQKNEVGSLAASFSMMLEKLNSKIDQTELSNIAAAETQKHLEEQNINLEKAQMATANLLEDLEEEKSAVEKKVLERTEDLEKEKEKLLVVTENMRGGAILFDATDKIIFANAVTYRLLNLDAHNSNNESVLNSFLTFFKDTDIKKYFQECIAGKSFYIEEINGGGRVYEMFFRNLNEGQKESTQSRGYFVSFADITEAKLLEHSKSELVAVASHQLRTPLTAMRGNVEMLADESYGPLNKEQHELLADVEVSTVRLITMVNEMLDITKIEKGDLEMTLETLNIKEILDSVTKDLESYAQKHEFKIELTAVDAGAHICGDKVRVRQVFQNLIDNAIKYSAHPGALHISTAVKGDDLETIFKDNGIGIPENEQPKLFGRFYRASNTAKTASSGSGLGLYIVKSIARQLGGDIRFESEEGKGTTFYVTLPMKSSVKT